MHEIYLAEKIIEQITGVAKKNKAKKLCEAKIIIPKDEHFTEREFRDILKMQAEGTSAEKAVFEVVAKDTDKVYIENIKIT